MDEVLKAKQDISKRVKLMVGYDVTGLGDLLSILTGPDVIELLENLIYVVQMKEWEPANGRRDQLSTEVDSKDHTPDPIT